MVLSLLNSVFLLSAILTVDGLELGNVVIGTPLQLWSCTGGERQSWAIQSGTYPDNTIALREDNHRVIDVSGFSNASGATLHVWGRNGYTTAYDQQFRYDRDSKRIASLMNQNCFTVDSLSIRSGAKITLRRCSAGQQAMQAWTYDPQTGLIHLANNTDFCLDAGSEVVGCLLAPFSSYPYCNHSLSIPERVEDLLGRLTLQEKAQFLSADSHTNGGVPRLQVKAFQYSECLHGVLSLCGAAAPGSTGCPTSFPHALGLGATFNRSLWTAVASTISTEARSLNNQGLVGLSFFAPDINLFRDPRWGRGQEVPGEDPFLTSEYVAHYSRALQEGDDPRYLKTISTCKHFSVYDFDHWENVSRTHFNAVVSDQDLVEYYWIPFRACVQRAHVGSIMSSVNAVNGVPNCVNSLFQNSIVRNEWGFDGFFVTDGNGITYTYISYNYTKSLEDACRMGIEAGTDANLGRSYENYLAQTVKDGLLKESELDVSVRRVMTSMFRLGYMDPDDIQPYKDLGAKDVDTPESRKLSLEAAQQMIVLLKNNNNFLPLNAEKVNKIAVIGPHANATVALLSNYHGENRIVSSHSPLQALTAALGQSKIEYQMGCNINDQNTEKIDDAAASAKATDLALVFVGLDGTIEREEHDRTTLVLPGVQEQLVEAVFKANKNTVVILINGGPIAIPWIKENVPAIVEAFYPGQLGGDAIADVLLGNVNPSGRLPYTIYPEDYTQRSHFDMSLRDNGGCTYRFYNGTPLWTFGDGMSYTTFTYSWSKVIPYLTIDAKDIATEQQVVSYTVNVTNSGKMAGAETVLGFLTSQPQPDAPKKELFDFGRVFLEPGELAVVHLTVGPQELSSVDKQGTQFIKTGQYGLSIGSLHTVLDVTGSDFEMFSLEKISDCENHCSSRKCTLL